MARESLYKALSGERSPGFDTILKVVNALGLKLRAASARNSWWELFFSLPIQQFAQPFSLSSIARNP